MNCKPGDLAIVTTTHHDHMDSLGHIVNVLTASVNYKNAWIIEFVGEIPRSLVGWPVLSAFDRHLRPVSDLPDDESTETDAPAPADIVRTATCSTKGQN